MPDPKPTDPVCANCCWWYQNQPNPDPTLDGYSECLNPTLRGLKTIWTFGCNEFVGADSVIVNVPQHTKNGNMTDANPNPVDGPIEIMIVTYGTPTLRCSGRVVSDLDWLRWCLKSIRHYCTGFQGVTVAHPRHETSLFDTLIPEFGVRLYAFDEIQGKGFLDHEIMMANADNIVPPGTKYVLHCDADCIFRMPTAPEHYFAADRPYHIVRGWESLTTEDPRVPGSKVVSDCAQWRGPTDAQLGFTTAVYGMCMNTGVFPLRFYPRYREHIEKVHRKPFKDYMLEGKNDHPTNRMDWTAMVGWAYHAMPDSFTFFTVESGQYPADRKLAFWSHGGIDAKTQGEIEALIK